MNHPKVPKQTPSMSRRSFLATSATVATAAVASAVPQADALAAARVSKAFANYQDQASGGHHCAICVHFRAPHSCEVVRGAINPNGVCRFFKAKTGMQMGRGHMNSKPMSGGSGGGGMGY
jgi:anaerobic selenocysteine-containing dehydrogenase